MKYLLQAIDARRDCVRLSDHELRDLLIEVRNGKDDKIEFTESMVRLLEELKSSEHATAFLTKVAKRDAPDYYDVIKNPMDLGTMMRNVRQCRYKSKAQFMRDLDLIWDNCLTYNSEPTHPLRRSVHVLRNKANHLLTYVNDTNDVKEALNQWQASLGLQKRPSEGAVKDTDGLTGVGDASVASSDRHASISLPRMGGGLASLMDMPFEQRPALLRNADGMNTFERLNASQLKLDEEFARRYLSCDEAGPSSQRALSASAPATVEQGGLIAEASKDMLKMLEGAQGGILRTALTTAPLSYVRSTNSDSRNDTNEALVGHAHNCLSDKEGVHDHAHISYLLESDSEEEEAGQARFDSAAAWWNGMSHPSMLPAGVMPLRASEHAASKRVRYITGRPGKRRKQHDIQMHSDAKGALKRLPGGIETLEHNVKVISGLRRTHAKYARLHSHIESGEPIPADLGVVSSDEEEEGRGSDEGRRVSEVKKQVSATVPATFRQKAPDALVLPIGEVAGNPYTKLSSESATNLLNSKTNLLLAHAGFDASHKSAADVVTDVAGEFLMNVGRTLRGYADRFSHEMSVEELLLHTLFENGGVDVRGLESYVADDVVRYGNKMSELLRKLRASYRDTLAHSDVTMADEAAYFGAQSLVGMNGAAVGYVRADGTSEGPSEDEHILRGGYAGELADEDFFGFKDMGLDAELGIDVGRQLAAMPSRMFSRRAQDGGGGGQGGSAAKSRLGPGSGESGSTAMLEFEPPEPFVALTEAAIGAQISLLRTYYRDAMRTRGQWQRIGTEDQNDGGDVTTTFDAALGQQVPGPQEATASADGAVTANQEEEDARKDAYVILPDEEQERQRYKVPPMGKMPRRAMNQRVAGTSLTSTSSSTSTTVKTAAKTSTANGNKVSGDLARTKLTSNTALSNKQALTNGGAAATNVSSKGKSKAGGGGGNSSSSSSSKKKKDSSSTSASKSQQASAQAVTVG